MEVVKNVFLSSERKKRGPRAGAAFDPYTKQCSKCKENKPRTREFFPFQKDTVDRLKASCKECANLVSAKWRLENPKASKKAGVEWKANNKDRVVENKRKWDDVNAEKVKLYSKNYYAKNREKLKGKSTEWGRANPERRNLRETNRKAVRLQAIPKWGTAEDRELMEMVYTEAAYRGLEVDHIVPLQGRSVCGLHVYWNTQLLTKSQNSEKNNKWPHTLIKVGL